MMSAMSFPYLKNTRVRGLAARTLMIVLLSMAGPPASSTIINVPDHQPSIQAAIDASSDTDTVLVAPGLYYENIDYHGKDIVISSHFLYDRDPQFITSTIIDGSAPYHPDTASCVRIVDGQGRTTVLQGFTLTGGRGTTWPDPHGAGNFREGGGVLSEFSSPTIQFNIIVHNEAINTSGMASAGGGGIRCGDGDPLIRNNFIANNRGRYGAGIVLNYASGEIRNNVIAYNSGGEDYGGGGVWKYQGTLAYLENNTIINNSSALPGGGVYSVSTYGFEMTNNIIRGNAASFNAQIHHSGYGTVTYCNVQGDYAGTGNIDVPVDFYSAYFCPEPGSPGVADVANPDPAYNDPEDPGSAGQARWPALGTLASDIGAYGGPGSYPFEWVSVMSDVTFGWAPLEVSFESKTWLAANSWSWDFGDGQYGATSSPTNVFALPGVFDVTVEVDTGGGAYSLVYPDFIISLADTITAVPTVYEPGLPVVVTIEARNTAPLGMLTIPIEFDGVFDMDLDSFSVVGCRTEYFEEVMLASNDPNGNRAMVALLPSANGSLPDLEPGVGPVVKCWLSVDESTSPGEVVDVHLDGYAIFNPRFASDRFDFAPASISGSIPAGGCCYDRVGDANASGEDEPTIGDVTVLIDALFVGQDWSVVACLAEADINRSGRPNPESSDISIGDISYLIDYLFITGSGSMTLPHCP
jgi:PKD repeat protein